MLLLSVNGVRPISVFFGWYQPRYSIIFIRCYKLVKELARRRPSGSSYLRVGCCDSFMAEQDFSTDQKNGVEDRPKTKKPYQEPAFRHERVFETMALACGKVQNEAQCRFTTRRNS